MSHPLELQIQKINLLCLESSTFKKLTFGSPWQFRSFSKADELLHYIQNSEGRKNIIILDDAQFETTLAVFIQNRIPSNTYAFIVISKNADDFLKKYSLHPELVDAIEEKVFAKKPENYLFKGVRFLCKQEPKNSSKISHKTLEKLNEVFIKLSAERDLKKLLASILENAMEMTSAQSGELYIVQERDGELFFTTKIVHMQGTEFQLENLSEKAVENSVCGFVALTGKLFNLKNVEELKNQTFPQWNKIIDYTSQSHIKSALTIPLKSHRDEVIGVLQLVNKNDKDSTEFHYTPEEESLMTSFATQSAICLDNVDLYGDVQKLFDGFVKASITAIEARDPSTGGHSERVAKLTVGLARAVSEVQTGIYRSVKFKEEEMQELEYAALLHDFGKIGVREEILVKAKKLHQNQLDAIQERIKICKAAIKIAYLEKKVKNPADQSIENEYQEQLKKIEMYWAIINSSNEPTVLKKEAAEALVMMKNAQLLLPDGSFINVLTEEEYLALSVMQGSLTDSERLEIESHVRHTYQFLKMIPWTRNFKNLADIAYAHHEKLDGTGYPRGLMSHEIPIQSKMMTIADIYDALTAADRWYKDALPSERALDILGHEVREGKIDPVLYDLFCERKIYLVTDPKFLKKVG